MSKNYNIPPLLSLLTFCLCLYVFSGAGLNRGGSKKGGESLKVEKEFKAETRVREESRNLLRRVYTAEIGIREASGKNDGGRVEEYLGYCSLDKGNPWCAAFVCWALGKATINNPRSAWSPDLFPAKKLIWQKSRESKGYRTLNPKPSTHNPQHGDVFGIYFPDKKRIAHCGFVDSWKGSWAITVEGNTNQQGSREGEGVYRKRRLVSSISKVADWVGESK